jgi:hypothetical protein
MRSLGLAQADWDLVPSARQTKTLVPAARAKFGENGPSSPRLDPRTNYTIVRVSIPARLSSCMSRDTPTYPQTPH